MGLLDGKTAVITGGTSGIGLAAAARFVDEGGSTVTADGEPTRSDRYTSIRPRL
jgi:NAD(P)-dependent dehydrogenase (short-subunit alcohol dehydrogenase family)